MMAQCYSDIPQDQLDLMKALAPMLVNDHIKPTGRVTYQTLVDNGLKVFLTTLNRDNLAAVRHNSEIISHDQTLHRFNEWNRMHSEEYLKNVQETKNAQKMVEAEDKRIEKTSTAKRTKDLLKDQLEFERCCIEGLEDPIEKAAELQNVINDKATEKINISTKRMIETEEKTSRLAIARQKLLNNTNNVTP